MKKTLLERIEAITGRIIAFDGIFVVWALAQHPYMRSNVYDLRDVLPKLKGVTIKDAQAAIPTFQKPKRAKVALAEEE